MESGLIVNPRMESGLIVNPCMDKFMQSFFCTNFTNIFIFLETVKNLATIVFEGAPALRIIFHPNMVA